MALGRVGGGFSNSVDAVQQVAPGRVSGNISNSVDAVTPSGAQSSDGITE